MDKLRGCRRFPLVAAWWIVAWTALFPALLQAEDAHVLANEKVQVRITETGKLDAVENLLAGETYSFRTDAFTLDTDLGVFSNDTIKPARVTADKQRVVFQYDFGPTGSVELVYTLTGNNAFFRRELRIANKTPLRVKNLAPDQFMGPFLLYPEEADTDRVLPAPGQADKPVCYTRSLLPALPPRYRKAEGTDGLRSEYHPVKVGWVFGPRPVKMAH